MANPEYESRRADGENIGTPETDGFNPVVPDEPEKTADPVADAVDGKEEDVYVNVGKVEAVHLLGAVDAHQLNHVTVGNETYLLVFIGPEIVVFH